MTVYTRKITKEQYDRAINNNGMLTEEDEETVFTTSEICGYGVSIIGVVDNHGQYYVTFSCGFAFGRLRKVPGHGRYD